MRFSTIFAPIIVAGAAMAATEDINMVTTVTSTRTLTSTVTQCHSTNAKCTAGANHNSTQVAVLNTAPASHPTSSSAAVAPSWALTNSTAVAVATGAAPTGGFPGVPGAAGIPAGIPPAATGAIPPVVQGSGATKSGMAMTGVVAAALAAVVAAF